MFCSTLKCQINGVGIPLIRGLEKLPKFNERGGQNKRGGVGILETALNGYKAAERTKQAVIKGKANIYTETH